MHGGRGVRLPWNSDTREGMPLMTAHTCDCQSLPESFTLGRRTFMKFASLGGGVALFGTMVPGAARAGHSEGLLLSCMDYRLTDETTDFMNKSKMHHDYDHVVLAGASLGAVTDKFPSWGATFWDHVQVAVDLHHINKVFILDHRDCGAYKVIYGKDFSTDKEAETKIHAENLLKLAKMVKDKYPNLSVSTYLMALDGSVEEIKG